MCFFLSNFDESRSFSNDLNLMESKTEHREYSLWHLCCFLARILRFVYDSVSRCCRERSMTEHLRWNATIRLQVRFLTVWMNTNLRSAKSSSFRRTAYSLTQHKECLQSQNVSVTLPCSTFQFFFTVKLRILYGSSHTFTVHNPAGMQRIVIAP